MGVYDRQKLPSVIRLIETTQPETIAEKIAAFAAPYFQPTVGIAAAAGLPGRVPRFLLPSKVVLTSSCS